MATGSNYSSGAIPLRALGVKKRGRPSKGGGDPNAPLVPCPGTEAKEGKCVELRHGTDFVPMVEKGTICSGCCRGRSRMSQKDVAVMRENRAKAARKAENHARGRELRQRLREDLIINLAERPPLKRGLADPIDVLDIMGLTPSDLGRFHELTVQADRPDGGLVKVFDFLASEGGATFVAADSHTARWQYYLHTGKNSVASPLDPENPVVVKVRDGLLELQKALRKADTVDGKSQVSPLGASGVTFTDPTVLYSRGQEEKANKKMPKECFVNQLWHTDHKADATARAASRSRKSAAVPCGAVPYSVLINCTPNTIAIIKGCGLSGDLPENYEHDDPNNHVDIAFKCGEMIAFRGDYVHGGSFYEWNHTRIHLNLHRKEWARQDDVNSTHVESQKVAPDNIVDEEGYNCKGDFVGMPVKRIAASSPSKARARKASEATKAAKGKAAKGKKIT